MQVYRRLDIGTAKASPALRREIPHHMIDVVDPDDPMSAGRYAREAREAAEQILGRGRPIVLCGGTGLYARAFVGGLAPELRADPSVRRALRARPLEALHAELLATDPESARRIAATDRVRIERALEAQATSGRPASEIRQGHGFGDRPFDVAWLALDLERDVLEARIEARVDAMFRNGLVEEVRGLRSDYGADLACLQAIGYREVGALLDGELDEPQARERIGIATRRYAKRQRTWFRGEPGMRWVDAADPEAALELALREAG